MQEDNITELFPLKRTGCYCVFAGECPHCGEEFVLLPSDFASQHSLTCAWQCDKCHQEFIVEKE